MRFYFQEVCLPCFDTASKAMYGIKRNLFILAFKIAYISRQHYGFRWFFDIIARCNVTTKWRFKWWWLCTVVIAAYWGLIVYCCYNLMLIWFIWNCFLQCTIKWMLTPYSCVCMHVYITQPIGRKWDKMICLIAS